MSPKSDNSEKKCENCGKALYGRTDKRFCNDTCRNTYNRQKTLLEAKKAHDNLPEIFKAIKRNYEILQSFGTETLQPNSWSYLPKAHLRKQGFNFRFCTSVVVDRHGGVWKFCFEYAWLEDEDKDGDVTLGYWYDQAALDKPYRSSRGVPEF